MTYELVIIGAGPAGITASVYAARKRMDFIVISKDIGGQATTSGEIENYTGYQFITGPELAEKFEEHMNKYNVDVKEGEAVLELVKKGDLVYIKTEKDTYTSKTAIIASGKRSRELGIPGEREFKNRGLTYCATCDGPLFIGKDVAIVGGGNSALDAALQLIKIANKIYLIDVAKKLKGDAVMIEKVLNDKKVTVFNNTKIKAIEGERLVEAIWIQTGDEDVKEISVQGVFVEIGLIPNSEFAIHVEKNQLGEIIVDAHNKTNIPGIFAAGDVTNVPEKQIIVAAGEGAKSALQAFQYLSQRN